MAGFTAGAGGTGQTTLQFIITAKNQTQAAFNQAGADMKKMQTQGTATSKNLSSMGAATTASANTMKQRIGEAAAHTTALGTAATKTQSRWSGMAASMQKNAMAVGLAAATAGAGIMLFLQQAVKMAGTFEDRWMKFSVAVTHSALNMKAVMAEYGPMVEEIQNVTGRGQGVIISTMGELTIANIKNKEVLKGSVEAITGASFVTSQSVESVTSAYTRAVMGGSLMARSLKTLGLTLNDVGVSAAEFKAMTEEERAAVLNAAYAAKYGSAANDGYKKSYEGLMDRVGRLWDAVLRAVGESVLPAVLGLLEVITPAAEGMITAFKGLPMVLKEVVVGLVAVVGIGLTLFGMLNMIGIEAPVVALGMKAIGAAASLMLGPWGLVIIAITAAAAALIYFGNQQGWFTTSIQEANSVLGEMKTKVGDAKTKLEEAKAEVVKWEQAVKTAKPGTEEYATAANNLATAKQKVKDETIKLNDAEAGYNQASEGHAKVMDDYAAALKAAGDASLYYRVVMGQITSAQADVIRGEAEKAAGIAEADEGIVGATGHLNTFAITTSDAGHKAAEAGAPQGPLEALYGRLNALKLILTGATDATDWFWKLMSIVGGEGSEGTSPIEAWVKWLGEGNKELWGGSPGIIPGLQWIISKGRAAWDAMSGGVQTVLEYLRPLYCLLVGCSPTGIIPALEWIMNTGGLVWRGLLGGLAYVQSVLQPVQDFFNNFKLPEIKFPTITLPDLSGVLTVFRNLPGQIWASLSIIPGRIWAIWNQIPRPNLEGIRSVIRALPGQIYSYLRGIPGGIYGIFKQIAGPVRTAWNNVVNAVRGPINTIIGLINTLRRALGMGSTGTGSTGGGIGRAGGPAGGPAGAPIGFAGLVPGFAAGELNELTPIDPITLTGVPQDNVLVIPYLNDILKNKIVELIYGFELASGLPLGSVGVMGGNKGIAGYAGPGDWVSNNWDNSVIKAAKNLAKPFLTKLGLGDIDPTSKFGAGLGAFYAFATALFRKFHYEFYYNGVKSDAQVMADRGGNCYDMTELLLNIGRAFGVHGNMIHSRWGNFPHVYAMFPGLGRMDPTALTQRGGWKAGPAGGPIHPTNISNQRAVNVHIHFDQPVYGLPDFEDSVMGVMDKAMKYISLQ